MAESNPYLWLTDGFAAPTQQLEPVPSSRPKPASKRKPDLASSPRMTGVRTDEELRHVLALPDHKTAVVSFGSSWCTHCHAMFPRLLKLSRQFPSNRYVIAQVDYMEKEAQDIVYTPTYRFYSRGEKVEEFYGTDDKKLRDHLWLHSPLPLPNPLQPVLF